MNCQTLQFRHVPHSHFKNLYYSSNCLDRTCLLLFLLCIKIQGAHIWIEIISIRPYCILEEILFLTKIIALFANSFAYFGAGIARHNSQKY